MKIKMNLEVRVNGVISYKEDCKSTRVYGEDKPLERTNVENKSYEFEDLTVNINTDEEIDCTAKEYFDALVAAVSGSLSKGSKNETVEKNDTTASTNTSRTGREVKSITEIEGTSDKTE